MTLVELALSHIRDAGLPEPETELKFSADRKWRFDFAWPGYRIALEIEGGTWASGRHTRGKGYEADCLKYSEAAILGWLVLRVTGGMVRNGTEVDLVKRAIMVQRG